MRPAKAQVSLHISAVLPNPFTVCRHVAEILRKLKAKQPVRLY